ncbi:MAG TPA: 4'-phosphopantetheinyl transferase superfamily protein, partial [Pyrinomonadaceae bacterium]|nr:4'-phosphopantetheinyl transferase superfamily protein [Pyrinomonadaceae bacterium]
ASQLWPSPPGRLSLPTTEVHVWRAALEQPAPIAESLRQLLSPDEQTRAARFHFEKDRRHFVIARGVLRSLLGRYLGIAPDSLRFAYNDHGKPQLAAEVPQQLTQLKFNLAHSGGLAVYAFTGLGEIGVDLEQINPEFTGDDIARRFFSAAEVACLDQLPADARGLAFFNCWTRKEAFIKAKGIGLSLALDQFDVTLAPDQETELLRTRWDDSEAGRWSLRALEVGEGYVGAVAVEAHNWQLNCWEFVA